jgi:hypothetical protein
MRPETFKNTMLTFVKLRRPCLAEGPPGGGKTQAFQAVAKEAFADPRSFILFHAPTMLPEDWALPSPNADRTKFNFLINSRFPVVGSDHPEEGIILIDEAPQAENSIQKSIANLIQEREVYGQKLKEGWTIFMTGNRAQDRAGANRILSHLRNRVTTIEFETHLDDWCNWALDNNVRTELVALMRFKPNLLHDFDPNRDINPTPRSWVEGVSPILDNVPREAEMECIRGAVGEGAAAECSAFLKIYRSLPDPDVVLMNPDHHEIPTEASVRFALSGALAQRASAGNFDAVMRYMSRMPQEFCTITVLDSIRRDPAIQNSKAFIRWASTDGAKILI